MNIQEALERCVLEADNVRSANTARSYKNGLKHLAEYFDETGLPYTTPAEKITIQHFIGFLQWLSGNGYAKGTLRVYISACKYFEEWLILRDILQPDFGNALRFEKAARNIMRRREISFPRIPAKGNDELMLDVVRQMPEKSPRKERNIALAEFLYSSGCRANEVAQLRIKDLDLVERSAIVTGKGSKQRRVYFSLQSLEAMRVYFQVRGFNSGKDPVFCRHDRGAGKKVKPMTTKTIRNIVRDISISAGIDKHAFTPHSFRHAFAIRMLRETNNLAIVQDMLGHADPGATRVYATIYPEELKKAHNSVFD